jgi:hypothetical protein
VRVELLVKYYTSMKEMQAQVHEEASDGGKYTELL